MNFSAQLRSFIARSFIPRSITARLITAVLAVELISSVFVVFLAYGYERHIHFRAFGVMLHGRADTILGAVQDADDPGDNIILNKTDFHIPPDDIYEVWDEDGRLLGRSPNWQGAGPGTPAHPWGDVSHITLAGHQFDLLRTQGIRTVDPGLPGGGKTHKVTVLYGSATNRVWHSIHEAVEYYALGSLFLLLVTGPLIAWLLHRGLLPLRQLAALASNVSVDSWQFAPPPSAYSTPELAPVTRALESVLQRLERSFLQQRAFVSDAAHELKTAVAVQKSSLQLLNMKRRSPEEYQAGLERCLTDALRLESLVADMLTLARSESARAASEPSPVADIGACLRNAITQLETVAALREITIHCNDSITPGVQVPLIPEDCSLVISNLLLNALQHSSPRSTVEIHLTLASQSGPAVAVLRIQDHGNGIPGEALPFVFDRFYRGDPSRTRNTGGTGLGLAIVKAIVNKAGGTISIASQPDPTQPNQGTTVTVELPLVPSNQ
jgi:signal transduction histidine kinase